MTDLSALQRFQMIVLEDHDLQCELRQCLDPATFVALAAARAQERGCAVGETEIKAAFNAGFHAWMMRGIDR